MSEKDPAEGMVMFSADEQAEHWESVGVISNFKTEAASLSINGQEVATKNFVNDAINQIVAANSQHEVAKKNQEDLPILEDLSYHLVQLVHYCEILIPNITEQMNGSPRLQKEIALATAKARKALVDAHMKMTMRD